MLRQQQRPLLAVARDRRHGARVAGRHGVVDGGIRRALGEQADQRHVHRAEVPEHRHERRRGTACARDLADGLERLVAVQQRIERQVGVGEIGEQRVVDRGLEVKPAQRAQRARWRGGLRPARHADRPLDLDARHVGLGALAVVLDHAGDVLGHLVARRAVRAGLRPDVQERERQVREALDDVVAPRRHAARHVRVRALEHHADVRPPDGDRPCTSCGHGTTPGPARSSAPRSPARTLPEICAHLTTSSCRTMETLLDDLPKASRPR